MSYVTEQYSAMASDMARAREIKQWQAALDKEVRRQEHARGETMALLVAALAELRLAAPDSLVLVPQVQEKIRAQGGWTIHLKRNWQAVWDLKFDLPAILVQVKKEHEEAKAAVIKKLDATEAVEKRFFWRPWKKYGRVAGLVFPSAEEAETARLQALRLAQVAQMGDELNIGRLLAAAK